MAWLLTLLNDMYESKQTGVFCYCDVVNVVLIPRAKYTALNNLPVDEQFAAPYYLCREQEPNKYAPAWWGNPKSIFYLSASNTVDWLYQVISMFWLFILNIISYHNKVYSSPPPPLFYGITLKHLELPSGEWSMTYKYQLCNDANHDFEHRTSQTKKRIVPENRKI